MSPDLDDVRAAYAAGWAAIPDAPMTERVRAACAAHMRWAAGHLDAPDLLEATIDTGALEGTWALIHKRREDLHAKHAAAVLAVWRGIVHDLPAAEAVQRYRVALGIHEADQDPTRKGRLKAAAAAAVGWLLAHVRQSSQEQHLVDTLTEAIREGMAEGATTAVLLAAEQAGETGDPELIYAGRLAEAVVPPGTAQQVESAILSAATTDGTRALLAVEGPADATAEDLTGVLEGDGKAADLMVDMAVGRGYTAGMLSTWLRLGGTSVDFVTAGDGKVCPRCEAAEEGSPYTMLGAPQPPLHPRCLIGSTRVSVPAPATYPHVVTTDETGELASDPALTRDRLADDVGSLAAPALTESRFDAGRRFMNAATERDYVGDVITIRTAFGHELTGTPNHPVATSRGWVALAELREGCHVLRSTRTEWEVLPVNPDDENIPPRIEDVAQTFPVALDPMPTAPEDFHGDGAGSDVHVVRTDRLLVGHRPTALTEQVGKDQLGRGCVKVGSAFDGSGTPDLLVEPDGSTTNRSVSSLGKLGALIGAGASHPLVHSFAAVARLDASLDELDPQSGSLDAKLPGKGELTLASRVAGDDFRQVVERLANAALRASRPQLDASTDDSLADEMGADPDSFADRLEAVSGGVAPDQIVQVDRRRFAGHVYNLDTVDGYYIGNGILTKNCRCVILTDQRDWPYSILAGLLG